MLLLVNQGRLGGDSDVMVLSYCSAINTHNIQENNYLSVSKTLSKHLSPERAGDFLLSVRSPAVSRTAFTPVQLPSGEFTRICWRIQSWSFTYTLHLCCQTESCYLHEEVEKSSAFQATKQK